MTLNLGIQAPLDDNPQIQPQVLIVSGPSGAGKSTLIDRLACEYPEKLERVPACTTRPPRKGETDGHTYLFTDPRAMQTLLNRNQLAGQAIVQDEDGHSYAVRISLLQQAWADNRVPVVEAPHVLSVALREAYKDHTQGSVAQQPCVAGVVTNKPPTGSEGVVVSSLYLTADVETLDVRLRAAGLLDEQTLLHELSMGAGEMQTVLANSQAFTQARDAAMSELSTKLAAQPPAAPAAGGKVDAAAAAAAAAAQQAAAAAAEAAAAASTPPPHVPHHVIHNTERQPQLVYQQLKEVVSGLWLRSRQPVPGQVLLEDFHWRTTEPGQTRQRLHTHMMGGGCLELGRGQHLLRITSDPSYAHAISFYSAPPCKPEQYRCKANELSLVLSEMMETLKGEEGVTGAVVTNLAGQFEAPQANGVAGVFRYKLEVSEPTLVSGSLSLPREDQRRITRMVLVDSATGTQIQCPNGCLPPTQLDAKPEGYMLLAVACGGAPARGAAAPRVAAAADADAAVAPVPWLLQLLSSKPLAGVKEMSAARAQPYEGKYKPNAKGILARYVLTPIQALQLSAYARTEPPLPFKLRVCNAPTGAEITWNTDYPVAASLTSPLGAAPDALLPAVGLEPGKYLVEMQLDTSDGYPEGWQVDPVTGAVNGGGDVKWRLCLLPSVDDKVCPITLDDSQQRYFRGMQDAWGAAGPGIVPGAAAAGKGAAAAKAPAKGAPAGGAGGARGANAAALLDKILAERTSSGGAEVAAVTRTLKNGTSVTVEPVECVRVSEANPRKAGHNTQPSVEAGTIPAAVDSSTASEAVKTAYVSDFSSWRSQALLGQQAQLAARAQALLSATQQESAQPPVSVQ